VGIALVNVTLFPMLSAESRRAPEAFRKLMRLHWWLASGIALVIFMVGVPSAAFIMRLVYGASYASGGPLLAILMVAAGVLSLNGALSQPLLAAGHEGLVFVQVLLTAVGNVVLNLLVIPQWGATGAAWVYLASVTMGTLLLVPFYLARLLRPAPSTAPLAVAE
jgi:O-antigen/teichoic acid export membrane protein